MIYAGLLYFAIVMGTGFVLGLIRVPFVVPHIGERWAELAEMPLMAVTIYFAAGQILQRFPETQTAGRSLAFGFLALALTVCAELGLAVLLQSQSSLEYVGSRDKVSGSVYVAMLLVFAVMPRLRLPSYRQSAARAPRACEAAAKRITPGKPLGRGSRKSEATSLD